MEILAILAIVVIVSMIGNSMEKKVAQNQKEVIREIAKVCPPHKWFYQEIKDHEGTVHAWKLVCEICGPLRPQGTPPKSDF